MREPKIPERYQVIQELRRTGQLVRLQELPLAERERVPGLVPERAPVIVAGAAIALAVMDHAGHAELRLSQRALRHGLWLERWGG